jgi:hypothetical protein
MTSDDDRIAYLMGDGAAVLDGADEAELEELRALLADESLWADPPPGLEDAVVAAVTEQANRRAAEPGTDRSVADRAFPDPGDHGDDDAVVAPSNVTALAGRAKGRPLMRPGPLVAVLAVAAALVVAFVLVTKGGSSGQQQFSARLTATDLAPGAKGEATLTKTASGWRIELDATGLPRLDNGAFYEAWLRNAAGTLVPIGTFNEGQKVTLWAGVSPVDYPTVTVTKEQADNNQASSGQRVLTGPVDVS